MIKAVLFDVGGVLNAGGGKATMRELFGVDVDYALIADIHQAFMRNNIDEVAFFTELNRRMPTGALEVTKKMFVENVRVAAHKIAPLYDLAATLRQQGIVTGIFSNALALATIELRARGFYNDFSPVLLSCEQGLAKPDEAFYLLALHTLGMEPPQVLFIDDQQKCLAPAQQLGMRTLLDESPEQVVREVCQLFKVENSLDLA